MLEIQSFLGGLSWMGSFSYLIWRGEKGATSRLVSFRGLAPPPANLFFNLSQAVPASRWGPHLDHRGSWLQGACPRPDSKGDDPHVWRPHKPGETHRHGAHVAQHILERCWGWAYPVRAWGREWGPCLPGSHSMSVPPSYLPYCFLPQAWLLPSNRLTASFVCPAQLSVNKLHWFTYPILHLPHFLPSPEQHSSPLAFSPSQMHHLPPLGFHTCCSL